MSYEYVNEEQKELYEMLDQKIEDKEKEIRSENTIKLRSYFFGVMWATSSVFGGGGLWITAHHYPESLASFLVYGALTMVSSIITTKQISLASHSRSKLPNLHRGLKGLEEELEELEYPGRRLD